MNAGIKFFCLGATVLLVLAFAPQVSSGAADDLQSDEEEIASVEERRILVQLRQQKEKNEKQAQMLEREKNELNLLRLEVDKKLDELKTLRKQFAVLVAEKNAKEEAKVQELSQMYNKMDSVKAASIISELDRELAIGILGGMKAKSAGKVLANIGGKKAAQLSAAYSTLKED
ncbi:MAG: hypothetical protein B6I36_05065 [Desulfobacteraceae bacterium 4572_35.1]|nr:MAG: hypothetical protein B6I36_05065 [Desulfobacteraceae bacterium 4572_35.1]